MSIETLKDLSPNLELKIQEIERNFKVKVHAEHSLADWTLHAWRNGQKVAEVSRYYANKALEDLAVDLYRKQFWD